MQAQVASDTGAGIAYYEPVPDGSATIVHRGDMAGVLMTLQTLARWIDAGGFRSAGDNRELNIAVGDNPDDWVTELQEPVVGDQGSAQR